MFSVFAVDDCHVFVQSFVTLEAPCQLRTWQSLIQAGDQCYESPKGVLKPPIFRGMTGN